MGLMLIKGFGFGDVWVKEEKELVPFWLVGLEIIGRVFCYYRCRC